MLVAIVVVITAVFEIGVEVAHLAFGIRKFASLRRASFSVFPCEKDKRTNSRAQSNRAAKQQFEYVKQALTSSGNPLFLGHRSVLRFGLIALDYSTNGGRAMQCGLAHRWCIHRRATAAGDL